MKEFIVFLKEINFMKKIIIRFLVWETINNELRVIKKYRSSKSLPHLSFHIYMLLNLMSQRNQNQISTNPKLRHAMVVFRETVLPELK